MVCAKCEKKLNSKKLACPDPYREGAREHVGSLAKKKVGGAANKALGKNKASAKYNPYAVAKCKICKEPNHQGEGMYCHTCAYKAGVCNLCGVKVLDTTFYKQSAV
ncbi:hypothetical protein CYMTET_16489 [Cymbomonas tetramitiformis]|uniref:Cysteine-rich PDZ-binding protein n=1 Tax=Cymbomonas tetramitiformis TaxID=36881 RepID=A0AAE0GCA7_9CHLO|nr:hypothetical protein CYMTET_16489 [Cymbomonas tetramitiformis]